MNIKAIFIGVLLVLACYETGMSDVLLSPEGRIVSRDNSGGVKVYSDTKGNGKFDVEEVLAPAGISNVLLPSAGRIILQGDGATVYYDSDNSGHYSTRNTLVPANVSSIQLTSQGRIIVLEKSGKVTVFTDEDGSGNYNVIHNLAINGVKDVFVLGVYVYQVLETYDPGTYDPGTPDPSNVSAVTTYLFSNITSGNRILLRYNDGKLIVFYDSQNSGIYDISDVLAPDNVDWFTVTPTGQIFYRVKGVVTVAADLDGDGIYETRYSFPQFNVTSVTISGDNRIFLRDSNGGLVEYFDKNKDYTYKSQQQLMVSGIKNFIIPSNGKVIIEGNDGSIAVYFDKDGNGLYKTNSFFGGAELSK
jgi:hypothetical protein